MELGLTVIVHGCTLAECLDLSTTDEECSSLPFQEYLYGGKEHRTTKQNSYSSLNENHDR